MNRDTDSTSAGGCYCGAVRYEVAGTLRDVVNCHCSQCTRLNGNFGSHAKAPKSQVTMVNDTGLSWYNISITARRGFCRECGSALFWDQLEQPGLGIIAGSLDQPTGLKTIGHIFVGSKSDFYEVQDAVPKFEGSSDGDLEGDHL